MNVCQTKGELREAFSGQPRVSRRRVGASMLALTVVSGLWLISVAGCTDRSAEVAPAAGGADASLEITPIPPPPEQQAKPPGVFAVPQEELAKNKDAIKISGTITVKGYSSGLLQIDVIKAPAEGEAVALGVPPLTVGRYKSPGPYELFLPPNATDANLTLILDLKGNGPDSEDPRLSYAKNPVKLAGKAVTGIDFLLDKALMDEAAASAAPPGSSPPGQPDPTGGKPPGEAGGGNPNPGNATANPGGNPAAPAAPTGGSSGGVPASAPATAPAAAPAAAPAVAPAPAAAPAGTTGGASGGSSTTAPGQKQGTTGAPSGGTQAAAPASSVPAAAPTSARTTAPKPDALSTLTGQAPRTATPPSAKPTGTDGRSVGDVLDESLDGAPRVAK